MNRTGMAMDKPGSAGLIVLPEQLDDRGSLVVIESGREVPFNINRVFYSYDVPPNVSRGGHAHRGLQEFIIAVSGSFVVLIDDGVNQGRHVLDQPSTGLYVPPMNWIDLEGFTTGAICLVLASLPYDENDYFRDYDEFLREKRSSG
jgi:WxcM-like, C-terminal